jgi:glycosyltransferase involved in cell wall biosynthesis
VKILLLAHFFPPEPCAAANRVASMREAFCNAGHSVTVVTTFPSFPHGRFTSGPAFPTRLDEDERGPIVRVWSYISPFSRGRRLLHWLSASLGMTAYVTLAPERFDTIVVSVPPITLALPALAGAWRHGARLVVDVRDVFPDIAIAMGVWNERGFAARACEFVARALYRRAALTIAVTPTALRQIRTRGIDDERLLLAPNAAGSEDVAASSSGDRAEFVATYAGNLGLATDVDLLADVALLLARDRIVVEIVGDGAERARLERRIADEGIGNLRLRGAVPRADALLALANAGVALVPLRAGITESIPTKLYDAVSVAAPTIVAAQGEARREAQELGALVVPPGDAAALARAIAELAALDSAQRRTIGERARDRLRQRDDRTGVMTSVAARVSSLL